MYTVIEQLLSREQVSEIRLAMSHGQMLPGNGTARGEAISVKNNLQLDPDSDEADFAGEIVLDALKTNESFRAATAPIKMTPPIFARYEVGMGYGRHVDRPLITDLRTDFACTIWLSENYLGGELMTGLSSSEAEAGEGEVSDFRSWKMFPGDCLIYPANTIHRVAPVLDGVLPRNSPFEPREVAVFWIQSLFRDPAKRKIVLDLQTAIKGLEGPEVDLQLSQLGRLRQVCAALTRRWAEPAS